MQTRRLFSLIMSILLMGSLFVVTATTVLAATPIYVNVATGNDAWTGINPAGGAPDGPKQTINAGIAAVDPGGTVNVALGVYPEYVNINKSITLNGANSGVACQGARGTESVIAGDAAGTGAVRISVDNVTLDGFQISDPANANGAGIFTPYNPAAVLGYIVTDNLITNNQVGMIANSDGPSWITCNIFNANNALGAGASGSGIYSEGTTGLTIDDNRFVDHLINNSINLAAAPPVLGKHMTLTISDNRFENARGGAIGLIGGQTVSITRNDLATIDEIALRLDTSNRAVTVNFNTFHDNDVGVRVRNDFATTNIDSSFLINRNSFVNNVDGVNNVSGYTGPLNAECNWWNDPAGPTPLVDDTNGSVDFEPWLITNNLNGFCGVDLSIVKTAGSTTQPNFTAGGTGTYNIVVTNAGGGTAGIITVTDTFPAAFTPTAAAGTGWACVIVGQLVTCTRPAGLAAGAVAPTISVTGNVNTTAPTSVTNCANVTTGESGTASPANNQSCAVVAFRGRPDLIIDKFHTAAFRQFFFGTYTIRVTNQGNDESFGNTRVFDDLPAGLIPVFMGGPGWLCSIVLMACQSTANVPANSAYPDITLVVLVSKWAQASVRNCVYLSNGAPPPITATGGELTLVAVQANNSDCDPTDIRRAYWWFTYNWY